MEGIVLAKLRYYGFWDQTWDNEDNRRHYFKVWAPLGGVFRFTLGKIDHCYWVPS